MEIKNKIIKSEKVEWKKFQFIQGKNFKELTKESFEKLKSSILKNQFVESFKVWDDNGTIYCLDGYHRCKVLWMLESEGHLIPEKFHADFLECADKADAARLVLVYSSIYANVTSDGFYEFTNLYNMNFDEIKTFADIPEIDFDKIDREFFKEDDPIEDEVPEVKETDIKVGDLFQLGNHRLMCGDSTIKENIDLLMNGEKAEMLFTDPPYGVNYEGGHFHSGDVNIVRKREKLKNDDSAEIYRNISPIIKLFVDGPCYTWFASTKARCVIEAIEAIGELHSMIIWYKLNATYAALNAQYKQKHEPCFYWKPRGSTLRWCGPTNECTIWEEKRDGKNEYHPTQKPICLAVRAISNHTSKTILDLFGGSGSTLIACEKTNRKCFMMELDPQYCQVIIDRWEKYTGQKAQKIGRAF